MNEQITARDRSSFESAAVAEDVIRTGQELVQRQSADWDGVLVSEVRYRRLAASRASLRPVGLGVSIGLDHELVPVSIRLEGGRPISRIPGARGSMLVCPPGVDLETSQVNPGTTASRFSVLFPVALLETYGGDVAASALQPVLFHRDPQLLNVFNLGLVALREGETDKLYCNSLSHYMLVSLLRSIRPGQAPRLERGGLAPYQQRRCVDYLRTNFARSVTLDELAAIAGLSPFHFARSFKQATGLPPHRYQMMLRINRARELLDDTDLTVMQVAHAVGYDSSQALSRAFRGALQLSPSQYRRLRRS